MITERGFITLSMSRVTSVGVRSPWTAAERERLLDWMAGFGLETYLHAPKDGGWLFDYPVPTRCVPGTGCRWDSCWPRQNSLRWLCSCRPCSATTC